MSDFVLTCESAADRTREFFESRNIPVVCFHYEIDDAVYTDDLYQSCLLYTSPSPRDRG